MLPQQSLPRESLLTVRTLKRLLPGVLNHVALLIGRIHEALVAQLARVRPLLGVRPHVQPQVRFGLELGRTERTPEGRFVAVQQGVMLLEVTLPAEPLPAERAHVTGQFRPVQLLVRQQV